MKPVVRYLHSPDVIDLDQHRPNNPEFAVLVQAMIGPDTGDSGEESFDFVVCSPDWMSAQLAQKPWLSGYGMLVMTEFSADRVRSAIEEIISGIKAESWSQFAVSMSRYGVWEFADYRDVVLSSLPA